MLIDLFGWDMRNIVSGNKHLSTVVSGTQALDALEALETERIEKLRELLIRAGATEEEVTNAINRDVLIDVSETREEINAFWKEYNVRNI